MDVVVDRAQEHDLHAAPCAVGEVLADGVARDAAGDDGQVLDRQAAERHEQVVSRAMTSHDVAPRQTSSAPPTTWRSVISAAPAE